MFAYTGGRTPQQGYSGGDGVRQQFTSKERDIETGLDYFGARYYASALGRFTTVDPIGVKLARMIDPQQLNRYSFVRNNPLKYVDADGNDLKLAPGLKKADAERIMKDTVKMYRKESGRAAIERLEKSDITFAVGTGRLPSKTNLMAGSLTENYGKTEKVGFTGSVDSKTGRVTAIDRQSGQINITFDFQKRDDAQTSYDNRLQSNPPPSEQHLVRHEFGHADDMNSDMVRETNQSNQDAENGAENFANKVGNEKPKEEKKKKNEKD